MVDPLGFKDFMGRLFTLEQQIAAEIPALNAYRWWEPQMAFPAVFNRLAPGSSTWPDPCTHRETVQLLVTISVQPTQHAGGDMAVIEEYIDTALNILDPALNGTGAMGTRHAVRDGIRPVNEPFGDAHIRGIAFPIAVQFDRHIS